MRLKCLTKGTIWNEYLLRAVLNTLYQDSLTGLEEIIDS